MTATFPAKPKYAEKCNKCGACCIAAQCPVSLTLFGRQPLCPALIQDMNTLVCGVVTDPKRFISSLPEGHAPWVAKLISATIGVGTYCEYARDDIDKMRSAVIGPGLRVKHQGDIIAAIKKCLADGMPPAAGRDFLEFLQRLA